MHHCIHAYPETILITSLPIQVTLLLSSTQSYKPSDAFTTEVYQVPYEPDFIEKFLARSMEKDKNNTSDQASGFDILNNLAESHANFCRSLVKWEGMGVY